MQRYERFWFWQEIFVKVFFFALAGFKRIARRYHYAEIRGITGTDDKEPPILLALEPSKVEA